MLDRLPGMLEGAEGCKQQYAVQRGLAASLACA
jgi:hypothetical protein